MSTSKKSADNKVSEVIDQELEQKELRAELLADLPPLRPAHRFRLAHRNAFTNLSLNALKSGTFDGDGPMEFDASTPEGIERMQKLNAFVESIDAWAETIAEDAEAYAVWAEGKSYDHFMALFMEYRDALGELSSSAS